MFIKIKGISPLKGINKWALEGALRNMSWNKDLRPGQERLIKKIMNSGKVGVQSQIYVRIGLEEQSQGTRNKARKQSRQNAEDMCGRKTRMGCPVTLILIMV